MRFALGELQVQFSVLIESGSALSVAVASGVLLRISSRRAPAYCASSNPYQRSTKKVWPLISPASAAPRSRILALMSEWRVFHRLGTPPCSRIQGGRLRVLFTS